MTWLTPLESEVVRPRPSLLVIDVFSGVRVAQRS